jgi:glycerol-3-phosphate dehydrogenase
VSGPILRRDLAELARWEYDLVVVGGGIFGVCAAWDAARRGLSVALLEKGDVGGATSANSFKMVHGGIRYLQHADLVRLRESCRERSALLRVAPHLVQPLPIAVPTYGHGKRGRELLRAGFAAYDLLTADRNRGIPDPARRIPRGRFLSRRETLDLFPVLDGRGLTGAGLFHDAQMYNPPRLALAFLRSAAGAGAAPATYVEATGFLRRGGRVAGVRARDVRTGDAFDVRGRVVLNAAGPWADRLLAADAGLRLEPPPVFSRDAAFVIARKAAGRAALTVPGRTHDPDALLARDTRHLFLVPWRDWTLVGVWHVVHRGEPEAFTVTPAELRAFVDEVNAGCPALELDPGEITAWNAGLVLFGQNDPGATHLSYGKRSRLVDHARAHGVEGLLTLIGVRYTTARGEAARGVDAVFRKLDRRPPPCTTETAPVHGGALDDFEALVAGVQRAREVPGDPRLARALLHNHGAAYREVLRYVEEDPSLAEPLPGSTVLRAEVVHAAREEMVETLADVVLRRTDLGTAGHPGEAALRECAALAAAELGWDDARAARELEDARSAFPMAPAAATAA